MTAFWRLAQWAATLPKNRLERCWACALSLTTAGSKAHIAIYVSVGEKMSLILIHLYICIALGDVRLWTYAWYDVGCMEYMHVNHFEAVRYSRSKNTCYSIRSCMEVGITSSGTAFSALISLCVRTLKVVSSVLLRWSGGHAVRQNLASSSSCKNICDCKERNEPAGKYKEWGCFVNWVKLLSHPALAHYCSTGYGPSPLLSYFFIVFLGMLFMKYCSFLFLLCCFFVLLELGPLFFSCSCHCHFGLVLSAIRLCSWVSMCHCCFCCFYATTALFVVIINVLANIFRMVWPFLPFFLGTFRVRGVLGWSVSFIFSCCCSNRFGCSSILVAGRAAFRIVLIYFGFCYVW